MQYALERCGLCNSERKLLLSIKENSVSRLHRYPYMCFHSISMSNRCWKWKKTPILLRMYFILTFFTRTIFQNRKIPMFSLFFTYFCKAKALVLCLIHTPIHCHCFMTVMKDLAVKGLFSAPEISLTSNGNGTRNPLVQLCRAEWLNYSWESAISLLTWLCIALNHNTLQVVISSFLLKSWKKKHQKKALFCVFQQLAYLTY